MTAKIENYKAKTWQQNTRRGINPKNSFPGVWRETTNSGTFSMNNSSGKDSSPKRVLCGARVPLQLDRLSYKASEACVWPSPFSNNIRILKKCISFHLTRSSVILILPIPLRERMHLGVTLVTRSLHKQSRCHLPHPTRLHYDTFQSGI